RPEVALAPVAEGMVGRRSSAGAGAAEEEQRLIAGVGDRGQRLGQERRRARDGEADELSDRDAEAGEERGRDRLPAPFLHGPTVLRGRVTSGRSRDPVNRRRPMPEPVIVATARSPIGRAFKGSLVDLRPDDFATTIVGAALDKVPQLGKSDIDDLMLGCGLPGGEQGFNMGRVVSVLAGLDDVPGTTITRYCSSSLQTIRMAAHAIKAGEGDAFIAAGVECVSRFGKGNSDSWPDTQNPKFQDAGLRSMKRSEGGQEPWEPPEGLPDIYIAMGQTAENVAELENVSREEMDEFA